MEITEIVNAMRIAQFVATDAEFIYGFRDLSGLQSWFRSLTEYR